MPTARAEVVFNRFPLVAEAVRAAVADAVTETAHAIEQDVKGGGPNAAPIRTGNLRRSYHVESHPDDPAGPWAEVGNDMSIAPYAIYVEYGTYKMTAQPHLTPAAEAQRGPLHVRVAAAVAGALGGIR